MSQENKLDSIAKHFKDATVRVDNQGKTEMLFINNKMMLQYSITSKFYDVTDEYIYTLFKSNGIKFDNIDKILSVSKFNHHFSKIMTQKYVNDEFTGASLMLHNKMYSNEHISIDVNCINSIFISQEDVIIFDEDCKSKEEKELIVLNLVSFNKVYSIILNQNVFFDEHLSLELSTTILKAFKSKPDESYDILLG